MRSIRQMARDVLGKERGERILDGASKLQSGDRISIEPRGHGHMRYALIRGGKTVEHFTAPTRIVFDYALRAADPNTLDGIRKVRNEPAGPKVN